MKNHVLFDTNVVLKYLKTDYIVYMFLLYILYICYHSLLKKFDNVLN